MEAAMQKDKRNRDNRAREEICQVGKLMYDRGYVVINDGNISVRTGENEVWITPSGVSKGRMKPGMMAKVDLNGNILEGGRYPSSEVKMHLVVYRERPDVRAVVHAHPKFGTSFAICHKPIAKRYLPEMLLGLGPVPVTEFAMPSTEEVPRSLLPFLKEHNALLLANHGVLTWGKDIWQAFDRLEVVESSAQIMLTVEQLGGGVEISEQDAATLLSLAGRYERLAGRREE